MSWDMPPSVAPCMFSVTDNALKSKLPAAFLELKEQLDVQVQLISKKSDVISAQQARIKVLEEQLRLNKVERFGASSVLSR